MSRILLVEPDVRLASVYNAYLESLGHAVQHRTTAQTAIMAADDCRPDLVLLELQLTNHSGIEFLYEFRSYDDWRFIPVLVISQVPEQTFRQSQRLMTRRLGVCGHHYKPALTLRGLRDAVDAALPIAS